MNVAEARAACNAKDADLANIYSEVDFEKARALLRSRIFIGQTYNHIWTGMTIDTQVTQLTSNCRKQAIFAVSQLQVRVVIWL